MMRIETAADPHAVYHLVETPEAAVWRAARDHQRDMAVQLCDHLDQCDAWGSKCLHGCGKRDRLVADYRAAKAAATAARDAMTGGAS